MTESLRAFVLDVSENPERAVLFARDPAAALAAWNLSPADRTILMTRESGQIRRALGASDKAVLQRVLTKKTVKPAKKAGKKRKGSGGGRRK